MGEASTNHEDPSKGESMEHTLVQTFACLKVQLGNGDLFPRGGVLDGVTAQEVRVLFVVVKVLVCGDGGWRGLWLDVGLGGGGNVVSWL